MKMTTKCIISSLLCDIEDRLDCMIENEDERHRLELAEEAAKFIEEINKILNLIKK